MNRMRITLICLILYATQVSILNSEWNSAIVPEPEPFSLDTASAIYCIDLLREVGFLEVKDDSGKSSILAVKTVWSYFLSYDESFPRGHRKRYDIIVNGEAINWDRSFIEYGGDMLNLRLMFLYKNQHPSGSLEYRNNP